MSTNALDGLLARVDEVSLRNSLKREVDRMRDTKDFGLIFEKHLPEIVRLYSHPIKRGNKVQMRSGDDETIWQVRRIRSNKAELVDRESKETVKLITELVAVRQFGEPIYPGLKSVGRVERSKEKPFHTVINAENYDAIQTLLYLYEGRIDCIYIDPPYNSGARDWKYNNDYVATEDVYRHSKWLSFMEKRLLIAKRLLRPEDSVLIVTIDEKEYLRLGLLLEQVFVNSTIQMVTSITNPFGVARKGGFSRVEEYIFFVRLGAAVLGPPSTTADQVLNSENEDDLVAEIPKETMWFSFMRAGSNSTRKRSPGCHFPIFVTKAGVFHSVGRPLPKGHKHESVKTPRGTEALWPIRTDGGDGVWQASREVAENLFERGFARIGSFSQQIGRRSVTYLRGGTIERIETGELKVIDDGTIDVVKQLSRAARTVWTYSSHNATSHGTKLLAKLIPGRKFPYPKSLYAVEDALRSVVSSKPNALILDFFGGSGTTTHAVARLNKQDAGRRRSILVTNNEVSDDEVRQLREDGMFPGDPRWEALGIFENITKPRLESALTGKTPTGSPAKGDYKFTDEFPLKEGFEENVEFLELIYLDRNDVARGKAFEAIAPLLWMKAGAIGKLIGKETRPFAVPVRANYAILFDVSQWAEFAEKIRERNDLQHIFVVTDSMAQFQQIIAELPTTVEISILYEDYLRNFEINSGGML